MKTHEKICKNCEKSFSLEPDDVLFYEKIDVPTPTLCPDCRYQRRISNRNEWELYRRNCSKCFAGMVSLYNPEYAGPVYCLKCFWSDDWDRLDYGVDIDFSRPFFEQFKELRFRTPKVTVAHFRSVASDYTNQSQDLKNCYMLFASDASEDCLYGNWYFKSRECMESSQIHSSELLYRGLNCINCARAAYLENCTDCFESYFLKDCKGCSNCFGCVNLRNKSYCWENVELTKEEYEVLAEKIVARMKATGEWGEFFPTAISPYAYNETVAQHYFPLTKQEVLARGWRWYDRDARNYAVTMQHADLPQSIQDTDDAILKEVISCRSQDTEERKKKHSECATAFRVTPDELTLYRKMGMPIPDACFPCRFRERLNERTPRTLWHRMCMNAGCRNEFDTSFAPDRAEIVFCEPCYQKEVV